MPRLIGGGVQELILWHAVEDNAAIARDEFRREDIDVAIVAALPGPELAEVVIDMAGPDGRIAQRPALAIIIRIGDARLDDIPEALVPDEVEVHAATDGDRVRGQPARDIARPLLVVDDLLRRRPARGARKFDAALRAARLAAEEDGRAPGAAADAGLREGIAEDIGHLPIGLADGDAQIGRDD